MSKKTRMYILFENKVKRGKVSADSDEWEQCFDEGECFAHLYASRNKLPEDFTKYYIVDKFGVTVAHVAAMYGNLPSSFNDWELKDSNGKTVAETYASKIPNFAEFFNTILLSIK